MESPEEVRESSFDPSPPVVLQSVRVGEGTVTIVRDDLLPGGTKQRGLHGLLRGYRTEGVRRVVYASPFCGFAQVALAFLCEQLQIECVLFCEASPGGGMSKYSAEAAAYGARLHRSASLAGATADAEEFCRVHRGYRLLPLGFDCHEFYQHYTLALHSEWERIVSTYGHEPDTLWVTLGSGTLARCFLNVLAGTRTVIHAVDVHVLPARDPRVLDLRDRIGVRLFSAPQPFREACERPPESWPANIHYDAKLAPFLRSDARDGDVVWNVAR